MSENNVALVAQHLLNPIGKGYFVVTLVCQYGTHVTQEVTQTYKRSVNNMWIIISIVLAINSMWLLKVNNDLANRIEYLIKEQQLNHRGIIWMNEDKEKIPTKPVTDKQKELLKKHFGSDKEDNE